jgi:hypothetical protein
MVSWPASTAALDGRKEGGQDTSRKQNIEGHPLTQAVIQLKLKKRGGDRPLSFSVSAE